MREKMVAPPVSTSRLLLIVLLLLLLLLRCRGELAERQLLTER